MTCTFRRYLYWMTARLQRQAMRMEVLLSSAGHE